MLVLDLFIYELLNKIFFLLLIYFNICVYLWVYYEIKKYKVFYINYF